MKKYLISGSLAALTIYLLHCSPGYANEYKTAELNRKMVEMSSLQQRLSEKISLAMHKRLQLVQKMAQLENEIKTETEPLENISYPKAIQHPRIKFNLQLMKLLFGYRAKLTQKINYFQNGYQTLDFYRRQVQDDLLMIKTLNDMEIDELIARINLVLDEFLPELSKPLFNARDIDSKDTETIWNEMIEQQKTQG
jgi:hypothetical protein